MIKQNTFLLLTCLIFPFILFSQNNECLETFRTGTFKELNDPDPTIVTRGKHKQVESFNNGKSKIICKIKWISDNEYELKIKKCINCPQNVPKNSILTVRIVSCENNVYKCAVEYGSDNFKIQYRKIE